MGKYEIVGVENIDGFAFYIDLNNQRKIKEINNNLIIGNLFSINFDKKPNIFEYFNKFKLYIVNSLLINNDNTINYNDFKLIN